MIMIICLTFNVLQRIRARRQCSAGGSEREDRLPQVQSELFHRYQGSRAQNVEP